MVKVPGLRVEKKRLVWGKVDLWGSGDGEGIVAAFLAEELGD
jgi:hypothetical protein